MKHTFLSIKRIVFSLLLCLATPLLAINKHEVRAVWLTTIGGLDWPHSYAQTAHSIEKQKNELCSILDRLQSANINTILLQTRVRATTIYPSDIEPWDGAMSGHPGQSPGYDPLAFAIDECHRRGMELHAWIVCIPIGKWNGYGCRQLRKRHPQIVRRIGEEAFLDPENTATASYVSSICEEVTRRYDIDGIHLDYIRYPETWKARIDLHKGRRNITRIVEQVAERTRRCKPWVKISCSPIGKHDDLSRYSSNGWNARTKVCQEAQDWLRRGLMDQLYPMMYFKDNHFFPFAIDWQENSHGRTVVPGLGIYFLSPREKDWSIDVIRRELHYIRSLSLGQAFFRCKFLLDNIKGVFDVVKDEINTYPALIPPTLSENAMQSIPTTADISPSPQAPTDISLTARASSQSATLSWSSAKAFPQSDGLYHLFNVYASDTYPVDTSDPRCLIATRLQATSVTLPRQSRYCYYAVTSTDRYGRESAPAFFPVNDGRPSADIRGMLPCNGTTLTLPPNHGSANLEYIAIESVAGNLITTSAYDETGKTDVSRLDEGFYVVRSLNRRGQSHRLGFFIIRR